MGVVTELSFSSNCSNLEYLSLYIKHGSSGIFPSTFVPLVPGVKNSILDSVLKLNPVKRKKNQH